MTDNADNVNSSSVLFVFGCVLVASLGWACMLDDVSVFGLAMYFIFVVLLAGLAYLDIRYMWLPDTLTYLLLMVGLAVNYSGLFVAFADAIIGIVAGYAVLRFAGMLSLLVYGTEAPARGDCKLLAALGAWVGWSALPNVIVVGSMLIIVAFLSVPRWRKRGTKLPYGPGLAVGGVVALLGLLG